MIQVNKIPYYIYIAIGILYIVVKTVFVSLGYLHLGAISHGAIPAILTVLAGVLSLKERYKKAKHRIWHWMSMIFPVLICIITPLYMYLNMGGEFWLTEGRLPVLIIYECFAIIQSIIAMSIFRKNVSSQIPSAQGG